MNAVWLCKQLSSMSCNRIPSMYALQHGIGCSRHANHEAIRSWSDQQLHLRLHSVLFIIPWEQCSPSEQNNLQACPSPYFYWHTWQETCSRFFEIHPTSSLVHAYAVPSGESPSGIRLQENVPAGRGSTGGALSLSLQDCLNDILNVYQMCKMQNSWVASLQSVAHRE